MSDDLPIPKSQPPVNGVEVAPGIRIDPAKLRLQYARSSGPGGQNVNKVNTKTELWAPVDALVGLTAAARDRLLQLAGHKLTLLNEIHIAADNHRTQEANRSEAFDRLRDLLVRAMHVPKARRKTKISKGAKRRRLDNKKRRGQTKSDRRYGGE